MSDPVNSPGHYTQGGIECIDAIEAATVGKKGAEAVCVANVIKYLWRYETKNGLQDVQKARWYLDRLIDVMGRSSSAGVTPDAFQINTLKPTSGVMLHCPDCSAEHCPCVAR